MRCAAVSQRGIYVGALHAVGGRLAGPALLFAFRLLRYASGSRHGVVPWNDISAWAMLRGNLESHERVVCP